MIDPIIFSIEIGKFSLSIYWYGLFVSLGIIVASLIAAREVEFRKEDPEHVWNAMIWMLIAGVIGARLWFVVNDILGGGMRYLNNPIDIIKIKQGGLHFYGGLLFGAVALIIYTVKNKIDLRLFLDSIAPATLIGQAVARPANFINQELYGQPTDLPWGIRISPHARLAQWQDMTAFPYETTRFHPAFAYEMIWNFIAAGLLIWLGRRFKDRVKPGTLFAGWLVMAGIGRELIEFFRPDQPRIPGTDISFTRVVAGLMAVFGILILLARYNIIKIPLLSMGKEEYEISTVIKEDETETEPLSV